VVLIEKELDIYPPQSHFTSNVLIQLHFNSVYLWHP